MIRGVLVLFCQYQTCAHFGPDLWTPGKRRARRVNPANHPARVHI